MPSATTSEPPAKPDPLAAFREGEKLAGCYLLQRRIEGTGDRVVWLANDEVLGKDVSLHFVPAPVLEDDEALTVLRHEARRNRQLIHPCILRVYDFIEEDGWAAVSMDAFTGGTLAARLESAPRGFFEPAEIQPWIESICQTLEDAHRIKLAHGDVTPENIVIEENGRVRIANFGLSICIKHALGELEREHSAHQSSQQLDGAPPVPSDDVFGVGVLIHRLLTGVPPFSGPDDRAKAPGVAERRAKLGKSGEPIPPAWENAVAACLARESGERPKTPAELLQRLAGNLPKEDTAAAAPKPRETKANVAKGKEKPIARPEPVAAKAETSHATAAKPAAEMGTEANAVQEKTQEPKAGEAMPEQAVPGGEKGDTARAEPSQTRDAKGAEVEAGEAKTEEAAPANIVEAPPAAKKPARTSAVEEKPAAEPKPAREASLEPARKAPAKRMAMGDDEDDYATGGGGSQWKAIGIGAVVLAVLVGVVMYLSGGDDRKADARPGVKPAPVVKAKSDTAATPAPEKPVAAETKTPDAPKPPVAEESTGSSPAVTKPEMPAPPVKSEAPAGPVAADANSKASELENAQKALEVDENSVQDAQQQKQEADRALAAAKAKSEEKSKSLTPLQRAADEISAGQKKREAEARAAGQAAEQAKQAAADKKRLAEESRKTFALADETFTALQKMALDPATAFPPIKKAADEMAALRKKRDDEAKTAEAAAQKAQQSANEKAEAAERIGKVAADGDGEGKAKLAAREAAVSDLKDLQKEIEEKQRAAGEASKALAEASAKRDEQAAAVQNLAKANGEVPAEAPPKAAAEVKTPEAKATGSVDPVLVKKEGEAMINSLAEKLNHLGDRPPATSTEASKAAPGESNPAPAERVAPDAPEVPAAPDASKAAGPGFVNSLGMKFVPVGDVLFCIWQTRVKDFEAFAKATGLKSTAWRDPGFKQGPDHPVVNVTWDEARLFCKWLTTRERKDGKIGPSQEYRLPTDLEWSAAVGLGEEPGKTPEARDMSVPDVYPWGTQWPPPPGAGNYTGEETGSDVAIRGYSDNFPWTSPVGSFPPNKYGLYDMGGNVWQWVMDSWNGESRAKVLRGALWYNGALKLSLLSSCRVHAAPDSSTDNYGFRVIIAAGSPEAGGKPARK